MFYKQSSRQLFISILALHLAFYAPAAAAATAAVARSTTIQARLPADVNNWEYFANAPRFNKNVVLSGGRFWNRDFLRHAISSVNHEQVAGLVRKLDAGQAITVMAMGSSITCSFGGEHESHPGMVSRIVPAPWPRPPSWKEGWLRMFMHMVNTTWPHSGHLLYNAGRSAHNILLYASGSCMEASMPNTTVDLAILEMIPSMSTDAEPFTDRLYKHNGALLEQLFRRIAAHFARLGLPNPPIIFMKNLSFDYDKAGFAECTTQNCKPAACKGYQGPFNQTGRDATSEWEGEQRLQSILKYYGHTSLSHRQLFLAAKRESLLGDLSDCSLAERLWFDIVHPSRLGQVLMADMLVNLLADAETRAQLDRSGASDQLQQAAGAVQTPPVLLPKQSLYPEGQQVWQTRCYGDVPADDRQRNRYQSALITNMSPPILILKASNWGYVTNETSFRNPKAPPKPSPGWVATQAGAVLQMQVNSQFADDTVEEKPPVMVALVYLRSYQHMGIAHVSCISGCDCTPITIDAHDPEPVSVSHAQELTGVTQHPACVLQVQVLQASTSPQREHKFKLVEVVIKSLTQ